MTINQFQGDLDIKKQFSDYDVLLQHDNNIIIEKPIDAASIHPHNSNKHKLLADKINKPPLSALLPIKLPLTARKANSA